MKTLNNLIDLLTLHINKPFVKDILDKIESNLLLSHTEVTSADEIYYIYYHRSQVQKELNSNKVEGYGFLLEQLKEMDSKKKISIYFLRFNLLTYIVMYNNDKLIGVLKSNTKKMLKKTKQDIIQRKTLGDRSQIFEYFNREMLGEITAAPSIDH